MSIFSSLRKSRRQAKEHSAKLAEQRKQEEAASVPYKHVPTHAASDAFACAPPSWREAADRPKILEQNRRRSAMNAAGLNMSTASMPRVGSRLSHVSYPSGNATPVVHLPRAQSYSSVYGYGGGRDVIYSMPDASVSQSTWKGKETARHSAIEITGVSPTPSKGYTSQEGSYTGSTSSADELEMASSSRNYLHAPTHPTAASSGSLSIPIGATLAAGTAVATAATSEPTIPVSADSSVHRLHPSHSRQASDASDKIATPVPAKTSRSRDSRPPTSMRGFNDIAAQSGASGKLPPSASVPHIQAALQSQGTPAVKPSPQQLPSSTSAPMLTPPSTKPPRLVQQDQQNGGFDFSLDSVSMPGPELGFDMPTISPPEQSSNANGYFAHKPRDRRMVTPTEQNWTATGYFPSPQEQPVMLNGHYMQKQSERPSSYHALVSQGQVASQKSIQQYAAQDRLTAERPRYVTPPRSELVAPPASHAVHTRSSPTQSPSQYRNDHYVNAFPEPISGDSNSGKGKKLTKSGGKLSKKHRWSLSKPSAITA